MSASRRAAVLAAATLGPLAVALLAEKARGSIERFAIAFALLALGLAPRAWLGLAGRSRVIPLVVPILMGLAAVAFVVEYPPPRPALVLGGLAAFAVAFPGVGRERALEARATQQDELSVAPVALAALFALYAFAGRLTDLETVVALALLACLALESWGPRASRTAEDAARRAAAFGLVGAAASLHGNYHEGTVPPALEPAAILLALASVAILSAAIAAAERAPRPPEPAP